MARAEQIYKNCELSYFELSSPNMKSSTHRLDLERSLALMFSSDLSQNTIKIIVKKKFV